MLLGLFVLVRAPVELAEAEVAVGNEGRIPSLGARERVTIVAVGVLRGSRRAATSPRRRRARAS